jgi:hypothetical protein
VKNKILKYLIYAAGLAGLYIFLAVRILPMFNLVLTEKRAPEYFEFTRYGELYYFSCISHFREDLPMPSYKYRLSEKNPSLNDAAMVAFGDSFFDFSRQKTVAERISDSLQVGVHAVNAWYPLDYLHEKNYRGNRPKVMIFQIVERNIHSRFSNPHPLNNFISNPQENSIKKSLKDLKDKIFLKNSDELYTMLMKGSYFTSAFYSMISTLKFNLFGYISSQTPVYDLNNLGPPTLFYYRTVDNSPTSFYFDHTDELISRYCDNIEDLASKLKNHYQIDMIFLPVPNKYTIYHEKINPQDKYDEFLPRLYKALEARKIPFVDIFHEFRKSKDFLYYGTDTHWNEKGVDITVKKILEQL